ncbi:MAG: hypothetical protein HYZ29_05810 [Myxococcales bacterium]|nr:hypothetical protein [Myxococcales bacterium]
MTRRVGLGLAALGLLRCGACDGEPSGRGSRTGGDASLDSPGGGGAPPDAAGNGGGSTDAPAGGGVAGYVASDGGLSPEQAWLSDPQAWSLVPGTEFTRPDCYVYEAKPDKIGFAKLAWQGCGSGCERAELAEGFAWKAGLPVAATHQLPGGPAAFIVYDVWVNTQEVNHYVRRVVRLDDGVTVGALSGRKKPNAQWDTCIFGNGRESARANVLLGGDPGSEVRATAPLAGGPWVFSQPAKLSSTLPIGLVEFDIDANGGALFMTGKGGVWALLDPKVSQWKPLETPSASHLGAGQGDLAAWTDYPASKPARIRAWATDGKGVRTLFDPAPPGTCLIAVTPTAIVSLAVEGGGCKQQPNPTKARFWWAPRKYDSSGPPVAWSPDLPGLGFAAIGNVPLRAWGDYGAVILARVTDAGYLDANDIYFLVINTSTGKLWELGPAPGHSIHTDAWAITPTHFYYGAQDPPNGDPKIIRRMFRLELAKLDQLAKPLN